MRDSKNNKNLSKGLFHKFIILMTCLYCSSSWAQTSRLYGTVHDNFGPLPGAKITIVNENTNTKTDAKGAYDITIPPGKHKVQVSYLMYKTVSEEIEILAEDSLERHFYLKTINEIDEKSELGNRSLEKSFLEASSPVQIITSKEIKESGRTELSQVLHYFIPSFHSTYQTISDGTDHIDPVTIRGLGTDQILVLINGKRKNSSSLLNVNGTIGRGSVGTDFNSIPLFSIERIEFLPYGAASIFGSDAIAGVINIVLTETTNLLEINTKTGLNSAGDGFTVYTGVNAGFDIGNAGFINITGEYRQREATNRAGNYTGNVYSQDSELDKQLISDNKFYENLGYGDERIMEIGNSATQNLGFQFNAEIPISSRAVFYSQGGRSFREGRSHGFYRLPSSKEKVVSEIYPNGFSPEIISGIQDQTITLGLKTKTKGWNMDISNTSSSNSVSFSVANSNNASLGINSPSVFSSGGFNYTLNSTNLDFTKPVNLFQSSAIAMGGEIRVENYNIISGEEASWINGNSFQIDGSDTIFGQPGAQVLPGFRPSNELNKFRISQSAYMDAEFNLSKNLLVRLALRGESYSDFQGQLIWKAASRYKISDNISIRGGVSTGYRAPSLQQVYFNNINTQFNGSEAVEVGTFNNFSRASEALGIEKLTPEISLHINAGGTVKVNENLNFNLEVFSTEVSERIMLSGILGGQYDTILQPLGIGAAQVFLNALDTRTIGMDISAFAKNTIGNLELENRLKWSVNKTRVTGYSKNNSSEENSNEINVKDVLNREDIARLESAIPNTKVILLSSLKHKKWTLNVNNTYFSGVKYIHPEDGNENNWVINTDTGEKESRDQFFKPKLVTDLSFIYRLKNTVNLSLAINNVFNVYPDKHTHSENRSQGNFVYSRRVQQFGVQGTSVILGLSLTL